MTTPTPDRPRPRRDDAPVGSRRPGGRTARTREAAAVAVRHLVDTGRPVTFADVAAESSINLTTLYRRWVTPQALIVDVLHEEIEPPLDAGETAGLRESLTRYATRLASSLTTPRGTVYLHAVVQSTGDTRVSPAITDAIADRRLALYGALLDASDAALRLRPRDVFDGLFAPLSLHAMLATPFEGDEIAQYVDNLCRLAATRHEDPQD